MIQAIGLTKSYRRRTHALVDLSFEAVPGRITVLLGPGGAGKTTALLLMVGQLRGKGSVLFDGRPYHRIRRPERQVGVVLPESDGPPGHPGRRARNHLRMLAAAAGVPAPRADELLEQTRLTPAADHRLRSFSPGMSRRLQLAAALLGDPHTLLLDDPTAGLSPKNAEWFHAFLRAFAASGGTVLLTTTDAEEAAALGDRVLSLHQGRLLDDQPVAEFVRTRLRGEVAVRGPQVGRLADLLLAAGADVRWEAGNRILVSGAARTEIGELAYRHGILLHELADLGPLRTQRAGPVRPSRGAVAPATTGATAVAARPGPSAEQGRAAQQGPAVAPRVLSATATPMEHGLVGTASAAVLTEPAPPVDATLPAPAGGEIVVTAGETVVVLSPGGAVTATVRALAERAARPTTTPGLSPTPVPAPAVAGAPVAAPASRPTPGPAESPCPLPAPSSTPGANDPCTQ
jgi:ABC-2 type transport system ATP-binding protein